MIQAVQCGRLFLPIVVELIRRLLVVIRRRLHHRIGPIEAGEQEQTTFSQDVRYGEVEIDRTSALLYISPANSGEKLSSF